MKSSVTLKRALLRTEGIHRGMRALTKKDVLVGVPADTSGRQSGDGLNNAELSYIHEFGTEDGRIPPRPHLVPGIRNAKDDIAEVLKEAAAGVLAGNPSAVEAGLNKAGLLGQNAVRATFTDNDWPPLAESTLNAKPLKKNDLGDVLTDKKGRPVREKSRAEQGKTNPLLDTGQLRKAHTYVIRNKGE